LGPPVDHIWTSQCTCAVEAKRKGLSGQKWAKMGKSGHYSSTYLYIYIKIIQMAEINIFFYFIIL